MIAPGCVFLFRARKSMSQQRWLAHRFSKSLTEQTQTGERSHPVFFEGGLRFIPKHVPANRPCEGLWVLYTGLNMRSSIQRPLMLEEFFVMAGAPAGCDLWDQLVLFRLDESQLFVPLDPVGIRFIQMQGFEGFSNRLKEFGCIGGVYCP